MCEADPKREEGHCFAAWKGQRFTTKARKAKRATTKSASNTIDFYFTLTYAILLIFMSFCQCQNILQLVIFTLIILTYAILLILILVVIHMFHMLGFYVSVRIFLSGFYFYCLLLFLFIFYMFHVSGLISLVQEKFFTPPRMFGRLAYMKRILTRQQKKGDK